MYLRCLLIPEIPTMLAQRRLLCWEELEQKAKRSNNKLSEKNNQPGESKTTIFWWEGRQNKPLPYEMTDL